MNKNDKENRGALICRDGICYKCDCNICKEGIAFHQGRVFNFGKHLDPNIVLTRDQVIQENLVDDRHFGGDYSYRIDGFWHYIRNGKNLLKGKQVRTMDGKKGHGKIAYWEKGGSVQFINYSEAEILSYKKEARDSAAESWAKIIIHNNE